MSESLLQTKLFIPQVRPSLVPRPRLIEKLNQGLKGQLTLISTPPGYGKSTLVADWLSQLPLASYGWVSLDANDNEPSRFLTYLFAALQKIDPELGATAVALLNSPQQPALENIMTFLVNDLAIFPRQIVLVLDDYHLIDNLEIHKAFVFLLEHQPAQLHLVIISQADPPFPLARLRVRQQVNDIRASDLRFTEHEAAVFLNDLAGLDLAKEDVTALESRTAGWIAGLQLAALSLQGRPDKKDIVANFAGSHHHVIDYLSEDVLRRQPSTVQTFLLRTSILDLLCSPLCDAVTEMNNGQEMLEMLERRNLFLSNQDDERLWYRYHPLFADYLRIQLQRRESDQVSALHLRAARWYEAHGFTLESVNHALAARDFQFTSRLVERMAEETLWVKGQWSTLLQWTEALPDEVIYSRPKLSLYYAWALFTTGQLGDLERILPNVEESSRVLAGESDRHNMLGEVETLRACVAYERGDLDGCLAMAGQALKLLAEDNLVTQGAAKYVQALAYSVRGDWWQALQTNQEAVTISQAGGNIAVVLMARGSLVELLANLGYLNRAAAAYRQARHLGELEQGVLLGTVGVACCAMGDILREWNDLETADRTLREGITLCLQQVSMPEVVLEGTINLSRVLYAQGDSPGADEALERAEAQIAELRLRRGDVRPIIYEAVNRLVRALLARGNATKAAYWFEECRLNVVGDHNYRHQRNDILLARIYLAQGRTGDALNLLEDLLVLIEPKEQPRHAIEALILKALAWQALGDLSRALEALVQALPLAELEGYVRLFLDEGEPMRRLLENMAGHKGSTNYPAQLLLAFPDQAALKDGSDLIEPEPPEFARGESATPPLVEPLNDRELAILRLMAAGLSNREIALELFLSVNTVKWYSTRIFSKLEVHKRINAVDRARELGIL